MSTSPRASNDPVALDAALMWREDVVVFRHLAKRGVVTAGEGPGALGPVACEGFAFARLDAGVATVTIPADAIATVVRADAGYEIIHGPTEARLLCGDVLDLPVGSLTLRASAVAPVSLALDPPRGPRARSALFHVGLAAAAHLAVLGLSLQAALASVPEDEELGQAETVRQLLVSAEERDRVRDQAIALSSGNGDVQGITASPHAGDGRAGGGQKAAGVEGKMGDRDASSARRGHYAVPERVKKDPSPSLARAEALGDAATFGMIGVLAQGPAVPHAAAWSADLEAHGRDKLAMNGEMWARETGQYGGADGLGLSGIGEGGGGRGEGIGLGNIGSLGHMGGIPGAGTGGEGGIAMRSGGGWGIDGAYGRSIGHGRLGGSHRTKPPRVWGWDWVSVSGHLPPEAIQRIIRQNFGRFRLCYENGLRVNPTLAGRVTVRFVIGRDGAVSSSANGGSDFTDPAVVSCVVRAFYGLSFPQPEGGIVTVTYPIVFSPGV
jgi:hypothetical protein